MEVKFELNIIVFQLIKKEDGQVVAQIVQLSCRRYTDTMYLNFYGNHFSLITNLDRYQNEEYVENCGKLCGR